MTSIILSFLACLGANRCQQIEMPLEASLMQCMLYGQTEAAGWLAQHPGWVLKGGYKCSFTSRGDVA